MENFIGFLFWSFGFACGCWFVIFVQERELKRMRNYKKKKQLDVPPRAI